ncbi:MULTISPECIES: hypothetical protein [unclassified Leucobacter]|uniref:hypothetical protein n=1 Tax=unclassified Leucobacter TaxID=2621730 RepID=UPI003017D603
MPNSKAGLLFEPTEVALLSVNAERFFSKKPKRAKAKIDMSVDTSRYAENGNEVQIGIKYVCDLYDGDAEGEDGHFVRIATVYRATFASNRELSSEDAESGALEPTKDHAFELLHPYHLQKLQALGYELIGEHVSLPLRWDSDLIVEGD